MADQFDGLRTQLKAEHQALVDALAREDAAITALKNANTALQGAPVTIPQDITDQITSDIATLTAAQAAAPPAPTAPITVPPGETVVPPAP